MVPTTASSRSLLIAGCRVPDPQCLMPPRGSSIPVQICFLSACAEFATAWEACNLISDPVLKAECRAQAVDNHIAAANACLPE